MDIKVIKNESKELMIEFETKDLTIPDLLAHELLNDADVTFAGVAKDHPEVGKPLLVVKTGKKKAVDAVTSAIERMSDSLKEMKSGISKKR
jgi:DNA-directed RNA polymerase subunit L